MWERLKYFVSTLVVRNYPQRYLDEVQEWEIIRHQSAQNTTGRIVVSNTKVKLWKSNFRLIFSGFLKK